MQNGNNEYRTLDSYEVLNADYIVLRVAYHSEDTTNSEECSENDEENLITH